MGFGAIAKIIIALKDADLKLRDKLIQDGKLEGGYDAEMEKLHHQNAEKLEQIIDQIGYPTIQKVGKEANDAAWLIIQHAIGRPPFMKKCLALLKNAVHERKANPIHLAYLSDRIAVFEGKKQQYGTQFDWDKNGILSPQPFDNLKEVNKRRKAVGLNTLEEQTMIIRKEAHETQQSPPPDLEKRNAEFEKWRIKVGWIGSADETY